MMNNQNILVCCAIVITGGALCFFIRGNTQVRKAEMMVTEKNIVAIRESAKVIEASMATIKAEKRKQMLIDVIKIAWRTIVD